MEIRRVSYQTRRHFVENLGFQLLLLPRLIGIVEPEGGRYAQKDQGQFP